MLPSSIDKFITGVWRQIYSSIEVGPASLVINPTEWSVLANSVRTRIAFRRELRVAIVRK
jgi:hypothetical protein